MTSTARSMKHLRSLGWQVAVVEWWLNGKTYRVSRHYVALHGLKARELEELVEKGIVLRM